MMTAKEAAKAAGYSETWLRTHCCSWCDQTLLQAIKGHCGAIYEKCDTDEWPKRLREARREQSDADKS